MPTLKIKFPPCSKLIKKTTPASLAIRNHLSPHLAGPARRTERKKPILRNQGFEEGRRGRGRRRRMHDGRTTGLGHGLRPPLPHPFILHLSDWGWYRVSGLGSSSSVVAEFLCKFCCLRRNFCAFLSFASERIQIWQVTELPSRNAPHLRCRCCRTGDGYNCWDASASHRNVRSGFRSFFGSNRIVKNAPSNCPDARNGFWRREG